MKIKSFSLIAIYTVFAFFISFAQNIIPAAERYKDIPKRIDSLFKGFDKDMPGGGIMVLQSGKIIFQKSYGMANMEQRIPSDANTNYRLASLSKQFTAMCIMILNERNMLRYDFTLTDIFPGFPEYGREITICHLLNHTSGLVDYEDLIPDSQTVQVHDKDVLDYMISVDSTYFEPGTKYKYSNSAYALLSLIVEKYSGKRYADFLRENIFLPLQMENTIAFEDGISSVKNRAYGYTKLDSVKFERTDQSVTSAVLGDGGIYSSLNDYFKWDQALYTDKIISRKNLEEAFSNGKLTNGNPIEPGYGFGWMISDIKNKHILSHSGSTRGFTHYVIRIPELNFTVIGLINRNGFSAIEKIVKNAADIFLPDSLFQ